MATLTRASTWTGLLALSITVFLTACGGSSSNGSSSTSPNPSAEPQNVQVVAGDGNSSDPQNTISWTLDSRATQYTVYWSTAPSVTANSNALGPVTPPARSFTHRGVDVVAGSTYYYRVQATTAAGTSALSAEVAGTPQLSITSNTLNDVAWNGVNALVAVGDSGVILTSPNGLADGWTNTSTAAAPQALSGVTWEDVNSQFLIVGAGSTVLTGDGSNWTREDLSNFPGALNLNDVHWLGDRYIAVGNNGAIITSNIDGSAWTAQNPGAGLATTSFNGVGSNNNRIVAVGTNGTIVVSDDGIVWNELPNLTNNILNDVTWDGSQFVVVGSNDTILTSPDGINWTSHVPGTSDINFVAVTQWDSGLPAMPVLGTVGSAGTYVIDPDADPGTIIRTGTTEQLGGMTWVNDGVSTAYYVIVGNDGTVLTTRFN